jgi:hypothetical protein
MGFVIFAGLMAMQKLNQDVCYSKVNASLEEMKQAIEVVAKSGGIAQKRVDFNLPQCYNLRSPILQIWVQQKSGDEGKRVCTQLCSGVREQCWLLVFGDEVNPMVKCLEIPYSTVFGGSSDYCEALSGGDLIELDNPDPNSAGRFGVIPQGTYNLFASEAQTFPIVCAEKLKT